MIVPAAEGFNIFLLNMIVLAAEDGVTVEADNFVLDEDEGDNSMDEEFTDQVRQRSSKLARLIVSLIVDPFTKLYNLIYKES